MLQQPWVEVLCGLNGLTHTALQNQLLDLYREQEHGSESGATDLPHSCMPSSQLHACTARSGHGPADTEVGWFRVACTVEMLTEKEAEEKI